MIIYHSLLLTIYSINITIIYTMPYVTDENGSHILDENGNKIEYFVEHVQTDFIYKHREEIHLNADGHLDTEDRHIVIKDGIQPNHAVCKKQLDEINNNIYSKQDIDNKLLALENKITASINSLKSQIMNNHMPSNFNSNR